jgi:hypothetical protein
VERRQRNNGLTMTAFPLQQSVYARCVRKKAYASKLQIHVRNCAAKLHSHFYEARKIVCNNLSSAVQAHVMELPLYAKQALPLIFIRLSQLANGSPTIWRNPARRSRNGREPSHKNSGEMSRHFCTISRQLPGAGNRDVAEFPRQQLARQLAIRAQWSHNVCVASAQQTMQHPAKHLTRRLVEVLASRFQP